MNWHDNLTDDQIHYLKNNKVPLGLCDKWTQEVFKGIKKASLTDNQDYLTHYCGSGKGWCYLGEDQLRTDYDSLIIYRLLPGWGRPAEPEKVEEDRWEYCDVTVSEDEYYFFFNGWPYKFCYRENIPGYGGVEFQERPDEWSMTLMFTDAKGVYWSSYETNDNAIPATPKRVRFLRRVEK